jgi:hypothetical protein
VEALIVAAMLMTLLAGGLFFHRLYTTQERVMGEARQAAWSKALRGCSSTVDLGSIWADVGPNAAPIDIESEATPSFFGAVRLVGGSANGSVSSPARIGGGSYAMNIKNSVACNEIVAENKRGDLANLLGYVTSNVLPSLSGAF